MFVFVGGHHVQALPFVYAFLFGKIDNNNNKDGDLIASDTHAHTTDPFNFKQAFLYYELLQVC